MTLKEYQQQAMTTCLYESNNFSYLMLNLVGEVGEFASKVAKAIRKGNMCIDEKMQLEYIGGNGIPIELKKEAGNNLWQLSGLCTVMGWDLEDIAEMNLEKLASRQVRGKIDGNGDNR